MLLLDTVRQAIGDRRSFHVHKTTVTVFLNDKVQKNGFPEFSIETQRDRRSERLLETGKRGTEKATGT